MDTLPSIIPQDLPSLSEDTAEHLRSLRKGDAQPFFAYIKSLRRNKWPLRAIATPLGVSRTAISNWEDAVLDSTPVPESERFPEAPKKIKRKLSQKYKLTSSQEEELKNLAHEASKVRRFTDEYASSRLDAAKLEELLRLYTKAGASLGQLAKACEVSRSSIAQRLRKPTND